MCKKKIEKIFHENPINLMIELKNDKEHYGLKLSRTINCSHSHIHKIIKNFIQLDLIEADKMHKKKLIKLTKKGIKVANNLQDIKLLIEK